MSQPVAPSKCIEQVELPWMPIFSSTALQTTPLRRPGEPSSLTRTFGARNSEMPLTPAGAPSMRASTRWMMLSVRSCSPAEMKIFSPVIANEPSALRTARVFSIPRSVPQCGSVRFIVPVHSPDVIFGRYFAFSSAEPCVCSAAAAPLVRPGYIEKARLAESWYSLSATLTK